MNPLALELIRQVLRWIGVYLVAVGAPSEVAAMLGDPQTVSLVAGMISYALADTGWLVAKWRQR